MASADVQGKFLWHELTTTDPGAAGAFYGKVLGWTPQAWDKDPHYTVLLTPKGPVGGMMKPGPDGHTGGSSAHWLTYVGAASVDDTAAAAQRLGGRILKGPADIPGGGRYAVLADPQGAVFGIHSPPASGAAGHADAFSWHELATSDHAAALRFYRELFGWEQLASHDMGAMGPYVIFGHAGRQLGGIFSRPSGAAAGSSGGSTPHWLPYVLVSNASKAAEAAKAAGGRVTNGPLQVPGGSWVAQLVDPHGAAIAVNQPQAAQSAHPSHAAPETSAAAPKPSAPAPKPSAPAAKSAAAAGASAPAARVSSEKAAASSSAGAAHQTSQPSSPSRTAGKPAPLKPAAAPAQHSAASAAKPPSRSVPAASKTAEGSRSGTGTQATGATAVLPELKVTPAAGAARKPAPRKTAARKTAGRGRTASRGKTAARAARSASAGKKRAAKKSSARSARGASVRGTTGARASARRKTAAKRPARAKTGRAKTARRAAGRAKSARGRSARRAKR